MRVLHVIPAIAPRYGGPSQAIVSMCRALQPHQVEPMIATTDADGERRLDVKLEMPVSHAGISTIFFSRQWLESYKFSAPLARWLNWHVNRFDAVHIHAVFSHACIAAAQACQRHDVPYVVRPLGTLDPWSLRQKRWLKRLVWRLGAGKMMRRSAAVHYTATEEMRLAESHLGLSRGVVIPLGVDEGPDTKYPASRGGHEAPSWQESPYVLALCRLHPKKGLELLFDAFLNLTQKREFRHWRLVVAGDGEMGYVEHLKRQVRERGGGEHVRFTGWLEGLEKSSALQGAALFALPSYQENFGLSVLEALSFGVPAVVSTRVNLAEDIQVAKAGWVCDLKPGHLQEVLADAMADATERKIRGNMGRAFAQRFTWSSVGGQLVACYRTLHRPSQISS